MPEWCPKCNAILPDGTGECPRCGALLGKTIKKESTDFTRQDFFWYNAYLIGVTLIPILVAVCIGALCMYLFFGR